MKFQKHNALYFVSIHTTGMDEEHSRRCHRNSVVCALHGSQVQSFAPANMITGLFLSKPADRGLMHSAKRVGLVLCFLRLCELSKGLACHFSPYGVLVSVFILLAKSTCIVLSFLRSCSIVEWFLHRWH